MPKITLKILLWTQHMNSENRAQGSKFVILVPLEAELLLIRCGAYLRFGVDERGEEQTEVQVFLPGESHGQRSLAGCKESEAAERLSTARRG